MTKLKRKKFNQDYCGDIIIIGFTGNSKAINNYLKNKLSKLLDIKIKKIFGLSNLKDEKFNLEITEEVVAHIETYGWANRNDL